jgi:hypothetical protein
MLYRLPAHPMAAESFAAVVGAHPSQITGEAAKLTAGSTSPNGPRPGDGHWACITRLQACPRYPAAGAGSKMTSS